tara:strand:- start:513 stop:677 length:165 start_codon:yes stop_codon:yes gene_type:complete
MAFGSKITKINMSLYSNLKTRQGKQIKGRKYPLHLQQKKTPPRPDGKRSREAQK